MWQQAVHTAAKVVFAVEVVGVLVMGSRKLSAYNRLVANCYADTDHRSMHTMRTLLTLFAVTAAVSLAANTIGRDRFADSPLLLSIPSVTFSALLFMLFYAGHTQCFSIQDLMEDMRNATETPDETEEIEEIEKITEGETEGEAKETKEASPLPSEQVIDRLREKMQQLMQTERLYLQPDLRIDDIARRLGTNRNYIHRVINVQMGQSFSDYINSQRIDHAIDLLRRNPSISTTDLHVKAGFSSHTSFFRNFKNYTGMTPKQFVKKLESQKQ